MSNFKAIKTPLDGVLLIEPRVFSDERGFFMESYSFNDFRDMGIHDIFVQDNHSSSSRGTLRGLHFQREHTQAKLVRVTAGSVIDVVVDLRPMSDTFGRWFSVLLSDKNKQMLYIPKQFAHGFLTLEDNTEFMYKCNDYYHPQSEAGIMWNDPTIGIHWPLQEHGLSQDSLIISVKDNSHPLLSELEKHNIWK